MRHTNEECDMENYSPNNPNTNIQTPVLPKVDDVGVDKCSENRALGCVLSDESFRALKELGEALREIHNRMVREGYELIDGTIRKKIDKI